MTGEKIPSTDIHRDTLQAMLSQERKYSVFRDDENEDVSLSKLHHLALTERKNVHDFRCSMVDWSCELVDFVGFQRETVDSATSYFDRFLASATLRNRGDFQLAYVTCLYLAIKCFETSVIASQLFSEVSHGSFTAKDIERMEETILKVLGWQLNGPTCYAFVRQLLHLIPSNILPATMKETVYELAKIQMELSLRDYRFISVKKSTIALAALMNAFESLQFDDSFGWRLAIEANLVIDVDEVVGVQTGLYQVFADAPQVDTFSTTTSSSKDTACHHLKSLRQVSSFGRDHACIPHIQSPQTVFNTR